ncbi:DUF6440 family protein [Brevibacillus sp. NPDC058079]|uniref:DUF6440 family protein n=1 Tax=Brevibacillus sp. NPDC058079 TaxID=3346330 RepID=UPI0036F179C7
MHRFFRFSLLILALMTLSACSLMNVPEESKPSRFESSYFGKHDMGQQKSQYHYALRDRQSGVEFLVITPDIKFSSASVGTTQLLDTDGNPLIRKEVLNEIEGDRFVSNYINTHQTMQDYYKTHYILTDRYTGVQYMVITVGVYSDSGISITPILDQNKKPILEKSCECTVSESKGGNK